MPLAVVPAVLMVAYSVFSARREERDMERRFPDAYPAYKARSKMPVPFLFWANKRQRKASSRPNARSTTAVFALG